MIASISTIVLNVDLQSVAAQPSGNPQGSGSPYTTPPGQDQTTPSGSPYGQFVQGGVQESQTSPQGNCGGVISDCINDPNCSPEGYGLGDRRANDQSSLDRSKFPASWDEAVSGGP